MKKLIGIEQAEDFTTTERPAKKDGSKLLKLIMLIAVLFSATLLSACFIVPPRMPTKQAVIYQHDNRNNHAGQHDNGNNHAGKHDNGQHRGNRK